ncbi:MAG: hypothetical protein U0996_00595 [Planctomycetaceae bacterium]
MIGTTLAWTAVATATEYEGGAAAKRAKILHNPSVKATIVTLPSDFPRGLYRAWVRAIMADGSSVYIGPWSATTEFRKA